MAKPRAFYPGTMKTFVPAVLGLALAVSAAAPALAAPGAAQRQAVARCTAAAEAGANRYAYGSHADVTGIRSVRQTRAGFEVRGGIALKGPGRAWRRGDMQVGHGYNGALSEWNGGGDRGSFTCRFERGRVADLGFSGLRGI